MPKINVYLPDELAETVKQAGVPVSAVCQRALETAVRRVTAIRETALHGPDTAAAQGAFGQFTARTKTVMERAAQEARSTGRPEVDTGALLAGILAEGENLGLRVLLAMEIPPEHVGRELAARRGLAAQGRPPTDDTLVNAEAVDDVRGEGAAPRFDAEAAAAVELSVTEAIGLGHNYVGCEHLLLGLAAEPNGVGGQVLRSLGAEPRLLRRAVTAALAGYVHLQAQTAGRATADAPGTPQAALLTALRQELKPLAERIDRLEAHAGLTQAE
ncbi:Clp protease N-terminal domain-containing protein [Streptomyces sp. NBC_01497]|uniref:Clp protease N-terminal domain-containing protein n=1 Tax=Streptomyces sp. NBC_01497 TaxID=2903885 RepID=UPI002E31D8B8|nr:Clp protease N-terminal domain-containing protein [Streptomyces sp. NBC_01497]